MLKDRRSFIKKALGASALVITSTTIAMGSSKKQEASSSGVVVGTSRKKEVLYKETQAWDDFYKSSY